MGELESLSAHCRVKTIQPPWNIQSFYTKHLLLHLSICDCSWHLHSDMNISGKHWSATWVNRARSGAHADDVFVLERAKAKDEDKQKCKHDIIPAAWWAIWRHMVSLGRLRHKENNRKEHCSCISTIRISRNSRNTETWPFSRPVPVLHCLYTGRSLHLSIGNNNKGDLHCVLGIPTPST